MNKIFPTTEEYFVELFKSMWLPNYSYRFISKYVTEVSKVILDINYLSSIITDDTA